MAKIDTEKFLDFVEKQEGKPLHTIARKALFKVSVVQDDQRWLRFKVGSSGKVRNHNRAYVERVIRHFNKTGALRPVDYKKMKRKTVNTSYQLALIDLFRNEESNNSVT